MSGLNGILFRKVRPDVGFTGDYPLLHGDGFGEIAQLFDVAFTAWGGYGSNERKGLRWVDETC
jgi:hypothetical protein